MLPRSYSLKLSTKQIDEFYDIGFIILRSLFSKKDIEKISTCLDRIFEEAQLLNKTTQVHKGTQFVFEGPSLHRVVWAGACEPTLLNYGSDPRILEPVSQILGSDEMDQLINQIHYKVPGDNVGFPWHQDSENRGYGTADWKDVNGKGSYVQTTMAIDPMRIENGTVYFLPKSGHNGHLGLDKIADKESVLNVSNKIPLILEPGDFALFGPYSVHGSFPNESNQQRRILINGYSYPGANHRTYPGKGSGRRVRFEREKQTYSDLVADGAEI